MTHLQQTLWSTELPDSWEVEQDEDTTILYRPDGFGSLQISALRQEQEVDGDFLEYLAGEHIEAGAAPEEVLCGEFSGLTLDYESENEFCSEWYLGSGTILIFATYCCALEDEGIEDDTIQAILDALKPA